MLALHMYYFAKEIIFMAAPFYLIVGRQTLKLIYGFCRQFLNG